MIFRNTLIVALLCFFVSCNDDESLEDVRNDKPVATLDKTSASLVEGETATFTINLSEATSDVSRFKINLIDYNDKMEFYQFDSSGSFSGNDDNYGAPGYIVTVAPFETSAEFTITPNDNFTLDENGRTLNFSFTGVEDMHAVVADGSTSFTLNVADRQEVISLKLDWLNNSVDIDGNLIEGAYIGADGKEHLYADWDFDLFLYNSDGNEFSGGLAATGDVPEILILENSDLPDDTYEIVIDLWASGTAGVTDFDFPIALWVNSAGQWDYKVDINEYSGLDEGDQTGAQSKVIALLVKTGNSYVLKSADGQTVLAP